VSTILEISRLTFLEAIRNNIIYGVLAFISLLLLAVTALAVVTMGRTELMIIDLGLGAISLIGNLMAIIFTIQTIQLEKEGRTLYVLLTRLNSRWQYIAGKYIGLAAVLGLQIIIMSLMLAFFVAFFGHIEWVSLMQACFITILEIWIVIAIAMIFAQTSSLFLAFLLTLCVDIAGRFTSVIHQLGKHASSDILRFLSDVMYYVLPNLEMINLRNGAGYIVSFPWHEIAAISAYGIIEILFMLAISCWIFSRRNLS